MSVLIEITAQMSSITTAARYGISPILSSVQSTLTKPAMIMIPEIIPAIKTIPAVGRLRFIMD